MKTGGGNIKMGGGNNNNSKFRKNIMQAAEEVMFSETKPWEGARFTLPQLLRQITREINRDPKAAEFSTYIEGDYEWDEDDERFNIVGLPRIAEPQIAN
jgi:hypothetical protein